MENRTTLMRTKFTILLIFAASFMAQVQLLHGQSTDTGKDSKDRTGLGRWLDIETLTIATRYRFIDNSAGETTASHAQHQEVLRAKLLFDPKARFTLNLGLASGLNFTSSWLNTGWGTGDAGTNIYMKQLFLSAKPVTGLEIQYGGLGVLRGESTEITSYDNDAYIVGQRASLKRPKDVFFDEIAVTYAYLGDLNTPNLNKRFHRLTQSNYHQFLVSKTIGTRAAVSADYTSQWGIETLREAVRVKVPESRVFSSVRFENYQRLDVNEDFGFALQGDRQLTKRLSVGGGYANIDPNYGGLNSDRFGRGSRLYLHGSLLIVRGLSMSSFYQHSVSTDYAIPNRSRFDLIFTYSFF